MTELWLNFKDEKGEDRRVLVDGAKFVVGRHSDCDLSIANGKLSRQHVRIEAFGEVFVVSDCGSSNGTTLNGDALRDPVALKDGDVLNLGGGLEIRTEMISDRPQAKAAPANADDDNAENSAGGAGGGGNASVAASGNSSIPTFVFIAAPALVIVFLLCGGGLFVFFGVGGGGDNRNRDVVSYYPTPDDSPAETPTPRPSATAGGTTTVSPSPGATDAPPTPEISDEKKKIEMSSAAFLQRIALNDPTAFLSSAEVAIVSAKIAQFKGSGALADNLKAVKSNSSQFQSLAASKGLKPQFLAVAALAELNGSRGNPLEVASRMLPVFGELRVTLANNLANDSLLMVAAYDQGKAGKFKDLRNTLEALAKKNPSVGPREIRTIWFLKKQGKITDAEYEFALRFLAIGTITQNPKDFGVNSEAVIFN